MARRRRPPPMALARSPEIADAAVGDHRRAGAFGGPHRLGDGGELRHARRRRRPAWCRSSLARCRPSPRRRRRRSGPWRRHRWRHCRRRSGPGWFPAPGGARPRRPGREWPWAVSITTTSTPASIRASERSKPASPTVEAAPTSSRPLESLAARGMGFGLFHVLDGDQADGADSRRRPRSGARSCAGAAAPALRPG